MSGLYMTTQLLPFKIIVEIKSIKCLGLVSYKSTGKFEGGKMMNSQLYISI